MTPRFLIAGLLTLVFAVLAAVGVTLVRDDDVDTNSKELEDLHDLVAAPILEAAMGWLGGHLSRVRCRWHLGTAALIQTGMATTSDEHQYRLSEVLPAVGDKMRWG